LKVIWVVPIIVSILILGILGSFTGQLAYAATGDFISTFDGTDGGTQFIIPFTVAVDSNGRIIVGDNFLATVQIFNPDGSFARSIDGTPGGTKFSDLIAVAVDSNGRIIVGDSSLTLVQIFNPDGSFVRSFDGTDGGSLFEGLEAVAVDSNDRIIVASSEDFEIVQIFNPDGSFARSFDGTTGGGTKFLGADAVAVDSNDRIIVADTSLDIVQIFNPDGSFVRSFDGTDGGTQFTFPYKVTVDSNDRIIVADNDLNTVQIFDDKGSFLDSFDGTDGGTQFIFIRGITVDSNDRIIVADTLESFGGIVQIFEGFPPDVQADLSLVKTFEPETISPGVTFTYFLTVKNNGPAEAENVVVVDDLPSVAPLDVEFVSVTPTPACTISSGKITCNLGNMVKDDEKIIEIVVKAHDEAPRGGFILNDATVTSDTEDPNPLNDEGNALIEIEIEGDLKLFKPDGSEISETLEEFPGGMVVVNDDNDNTDGSFDLNDIGSTINEDELVKLEIAQLTSPKGELYLNGNLGTEVAVYKTSDRTGEITSFPVEVSESDVFFIEGLKPSIFTQVNFELTPLNQPLESLDLVRLTVIKIESITFSGNGNSFAKDDNLDFNINPATGNTLGERVFPGARIEGSPEMIGPFGSKDKVTVTVELSTIVPFETKVFLKSFDVDDPGANTAPIDPNHDALGGTSGDYRNAVNVGSATACNRVMPAPFRF